MGVASMVAGAPDRAQKHARAIGVLPHVDRQVPARTPQQRHGVPPRQSAVRDAVTDHGLHGRLPMVMSRRS
jgi:hypothetical protein